MLPMKDRFLFATMESSSYSLSLSEWGLQRPPQLTFEYWWKATRIGRLSGLAVGLIGGWITYLEAQNMLPDGTAAIFAMFGQSSASKVVNVFMGDLISQAALLFCLLSLSLFVGIHRFVHAGAYKPMGRIGAATVLSHTAMQAGLAAVAFLAMGYSCIACLTGAWRYALGFSLLAALTLTYCAIAWSIFRFMFAFSDRDHGWKSRLIGGMMAFSALAMPWMLEGVAYLQERLHAWMILSR